MTEDPTLRGADPDIQAVADALVDRLDAGDELSAWALVETSEGLTFMILLIRDGSGPARILFGAHRSGERSLPDRIVLDDLASEAVAHGVARALGRAVQRGEAPAGSRLRLVSTGTPTHGPQSAELDPMPAGAIATGPSRTAIS